jgi:integrase
LNPGLRHLFNQLTLSGRNIMTPVRGVFDYAQRTGKTKHDITGNILWRKHQAPDPDPLERDEVILLLAHPRAAFHPMWHNYFEIAILAGLRPSELIALRWPAVDARREQVRVDAARVRARDKGTKTNKIRYVDLQTPALNAPGRQRALTWSPNGFVFINPRTRQRFADSSRPPEAWHKALRGVNIGERGAKQTRHTYATLCLHEFRLRLGTNGPC